MTERERFIKALKREPIEGHCPTFELVFFLTLEAIGRIHPSQQRFDQWNQMTAAEKKSSLSKKAWIPMSRTQAPSRTMWP